MTTIGIISDTHIPYSAGGTARKIPLEVFEAFKGVDLILHAGDFTSYRVVVELETIAPLVGVRGNNDEFEIINRMSSTHQMTIEECRIGLAHGDRAGAFFDKPFGEIAYTGAAAANAASHFEDVHCVVFGHSHWPLNQWRTVRGREVLLFNPGSPTWRRRAAQHSCGLLRVDGNRIDGELIFW